MPVTTTARASSAIDTPHSLESTIDYRRWCRVVIRMVVFAPVTRAVTTIYRAVERKRYTRFASDFD
jgi:hypothetical protein